EHWLFNRFNITSNNTARLKDVTNTVTQLSSNAVVVAAGANITVTPTSSGSTMTYTVASGAGGGTNQLIQTNGVNLGSGGTVNWANGVTGFISGAVMTLGTSGSGGGNLTTNPTQFAGAPLSIKKGAQMTNADFYGITTNN